MPDPFLSNIPEQNNSDETKNHDNNQENSSNIENNQNTSDQKPKIKHIDDLPKTAKKDNKQTTQTTKVKKWSKISIFYFFMWCMIFFLLLMWMTIFWTFYIIQNPEQLKSIWLEEESLKKFLYSIVALFFWILFFTWLFLFIMNIYRLLVYKLWKVKYLFWTIIWFIFLAFALWWWMYAFSEINKLQSQKIIKTNNIVDYYVSVQSSFQWSVKLQWEQIVLWKIPKIAPLYFYFSLNREIFLTQIANKRWISPSRFEIDCWNWQEPLKETYNNLVWKSPRFPNYCLYIKKWDYILKLKYFYVDRATNKEKSDEIELPKIDINSQVDIFVEWNPNALDEKNLNDNKNEIILWANPINIQFDSKKIFSDLNISSYDIDWYLNWEKIDWSTDNTILNMPFTKEWLYEISYNLPSFNKYFPAFFVRVQPSSLWKCDVIVEKKWEWKYTINIDRLNSNELSSYKFELLDLDKLNTKKIEKKSLKFLYELPEWWKYKFLFKYTTLKNENWYCESEEINTQIGSFKILYDLMWKLTLDKEFKKLSLNETEKKYIVNKIPYILNLKINNIIPNQNDIIPEVFIWEQSYPNIWENSFEIELNEEKEYDIQINLTRNWQIVYTEKVPLKVEKRPLIANLTVTPDSWFEPLTVELDASLSEINDKEDEIIYFTFDFWDWQVKNKVSQWKIRHTYVFDKVREDWIFKPKVSVYSKKWLEDSTTSSISVKKEVKKIEIELAPPNNHQTAREMEPVRMNIKTDWDIKKIYWDFWNWKEVSWNWREVQETVTTYDKKWIYTIKVRVEYEDYPESFADLKIRVVE